MGYRSYHTKGSGKIKVKPTLYFTQEQKDLIDKWRSRSIHFNHKQISEYDYKIRSLAEFVEEATNKHIADLEERTKKFEIEKRKY